MTPEKRREICSLGGKSIPREKRSFSQNKDLAREAGRRGGSAPRRMKTRLTEVEITAFLESVANDTAVES